MILADNPVANTLSAIVIIGITVLLCIFLYKRIIKEQKAFKEEKANFIDGILSKNEIVSNINTYINKITRDIIFGVIYINVDKFTETKNAFGEAEAKRIIDTIAKKVLKNVPRNVVIGRYGLDTFVAFVKGDESQSDVIKIANLIKTTINEPILVYGDTSYNASVTISIAFYPTHGENFKQLFSSLEIAMYTGKRDGGNKVCVYSEEIGEKETGNLEYYTQIKEAIKNNEFMLYYQPIIDVANQKVYGLEGLLRWNHPIHGVLSPNSFIHILEQTGDINWVGIWGVETLIKKYFDLKRDFPFLDIQFSINLSPKQLNDTKLSASFQKLLKDYKFNPSNITIEILEYAVFEKLDIVKQNIKNLKELGFKIAVDGFSLDQATISRLGDTPIDIIKLDREFFPLDENAIIKERFTSLLIDYAKEKDITVIAEGVEDKKMLKFASEHMVNFVQGYYFSKPISSTDIVSFINDKTNLINKCSLEEDVIEPLNDDIDYSLDSEELLDSDQDALSADTTLLDDNIELTNELEESNLIEDSNELVNETLSNSEEKTELVSSDENLEEIESIDNDSFKDKEIIDSVINEDNASDDQEKEENKPEE